MKAWKHPDLPETGVCDDMGPAVAKTWRILAGCLAGLLLAAPVTGVCETAETDQLPRFVLAQAHAVSLDEAVRIVRSRTGARVVRAETRVVGQRTVHFVRVVTEGGRVRTLRVDAVTGEIL